MAPPRACNRPVAKRKKSGNLLQSVWDKYANRSFLKYLAFEPAALPIVAVLIVLVEAAINVFVIRRVPYTEIDWVAYMQVSVGEGSYRKVTNKALHFAGMRGLSQWHHKLRAAAR